jgi:hypothetical protein
VLLIGVAAQMLPFKGSLLVPSPDVVLAGLFTDESGRLLLDGTWPAGVPVGASVWLQAWSHSSAWTASDGLKATVP